MGNEKLEPSNHTLLMNYIIGMCKKHKDWITVLSDLGYNPELVEQRIRTDSNNSVQPDVVATSNKLDHSLVFECKGGTTVDKDQLTRYGTLTKDNLLRWVGPFDPDNFKFDICISDVEENHPLIAPFRNSFPIITFGSSTVFKTGDFQEKRLNAAFKEPIDRKGKIPPLSYYPFSENDKEAYIAVFVIRGLVSVALKHAKGGPSVNDNILITNDELLIAVFNPIFDALSLEHKRLLKEKIRLVMRGIMSQKALTEALGLIEQSAGYKVSRPLDKVLTEAEKFIEFLETQSNLSQFLDVS